MKTYFFIFLLFLFLISCNDEDSPKLDSNSLSIVVGDNIYTLLQGNNQTGAPGQYLEKDIEILIKDLQGNPTYRQLNFELNDKSGVLENNLYNFYSSDTIKLKWKLGCETVQQHVKIIDPLVCNIAKSGCIEVDIFEIVANATGEIGTGC